MRALVATENSGLFHRSRPSYHHKICSSQSSCDIFNVSSRTVQILSQCPVFFAPLALLFSLRPPQPAWSDRAVEVQLVYALKRAKLLRTLGEAQYQRCGRTDKGVSALGQVVTINLRSCLTAGVGVLPRFPERQSGEARDAAVGVADGGGSSAHQDELPVHAISLPVHSVSFSIRLFGMSSSHHRSHHSTIVL
jgi:hypothetical protein